MTTTQVPIVAWERRYMTPRECARLQSLHDLPHLPDGATSAFKALGNAVNADLVQLVVKALLQPEGMGFAAQHVMELPRFRKLEQVIHVGA